MIKSSLLRYMVPALSGSTNSVGIFWWHPPARGKKHASPEETHCAMLRHVPDPKSATGATVQTGLSAGGWTNPFQKYTLPETNNSHLKIGHPNRKLVFQPSIFTGYVSFREGKSKWESSPSRDEHEKYFETTTQRFSVVLNGPKNMTIFSETSWTLQWF